MVSGNRRDEATLYYLYMLADGEITENEDKLYKKICRELGVLADDRKEIVKKCKTYMVDGNDMLTIIKKYEIDKKAGMSGYLLKHASSLSRIIWNLVNLGYADSIYSTEESEIVKYLVDTWSVNIEIYKEFQDMADTMLALTNQKVWIESTFADEEVKEKKVKKIDLDINKILKDLNLTIEEIEM